MRKLPRALLGILSLLFLACRTTPPPGGDPTEPHPRLHDIWALEAIDGTPDEFSQLRNRPLLEIYTAERRVGGTDGCNQIMGTLSEVTASTLRFGPMGGTKMMCSSMDVPQKFGEYLAATRRYEIRELNLFLFGEDGEELLRFRKID